MRRACHYRTRTGRKKWERHNRTLAALRLQQRWAGLRKESSRQSLVRNKNKQWGKEWMLDL